MGKLGGRLSKVLIRCYTLLGLLASLSNPANSQTPSSGPSRSPSPGPVREVMQLGFSMNATGISSAVGTSPSFANDLSIAFARAAGQQWTNFTIISVIDNRIRYPTFSPVATAPSATIPSSQAPLQLSSRPSSAPTLPPTFLPSALPGSPVPSSAPIVAPTLPPIFLPSAPPGSSISSLAPTLLPTVAPTLPPTFLPSAPPVGRRRLLYDDSVTIRITGIIFSNGTTRFNFATYTPLNATEMRTITTAMIQSGYSEMIVRSLKAIRLNSFAVWTRSPSTQPSLAPTVSPTAPPSFAPTVSPTAPPSSAPTVSPTAPPSFAPTVSPTAPPSFAPSLSPTAPPSFAPSSAPTVSPTAPPSFAPSLSPTAQPSFAPSFAPTVSPSFAPSFAPTAPPSFAPSFAPTLSPTAQPSFAPSFAPIVSPSFAPSLSPTAPPSFAPSFAPTLSPTAPPSFAPSFAPTAPPSFAPSPQPTMAPTNLTTNIPSDLPTETPTTALPTMAPTNQTTNIPSDLPTEIPTTALPTMAPTNQTTNIPTDLPTETPTTATPTTAQPTDQPTNIPTQLPTEQPSGRPSSLPSAQPSSRPTVKASSQPTIPPTSQPFPSRQPSPSPSSQLTAVPSRQPSYAPTSVYPDSGTYDVIVFTVGVNFFNLSMSTFTNPAAVIDIRNAVARSMTGVRLRDVGFEGYNITVVSGRRLNDFKSSNTPGNDLGKAHFAITERKSKTKVKLNVTASLTRLGAVNGTAAFQSLSSKLYNSFSSGAFISYTQSSTSSLALASSVTLDPISTFTIATLSAPDYTVIVPSVSAVSITDITRSSITLSVILVNNGTGNSDSAGGTLYCAAFENGVSPLSTGSVKSAASDGSHSHGAFTAIPSSATYPLTLDVFISGLSSLKSYSTFCFVESSIRTGSTLNEVLATKRGTTTLCCKSINYVNSPVFVFGDILKYTTSSSSLYLFSYVLSDPPLIAVTITPVVLRNGVVSSDVSVLPAQIMFSNSSLLAGQFYLSAGRSISGSYTVKLILSGPSATQFTGPNLSVEVLSSISQLPAPSMLSSKFSDSGQEVVITFNKPTDSAGIKAAIWPCSGLFSFVGAAITSCKWVNASAVVASFGVVDSVQTSVMYLARGADVNLKAGLLRSYCTESASFCLNNPPASAARVSTQSPSNPSSPTVVVSAPSTLGACTNLTLDATGSYGSGGRLYTSVVWTVTTTSTGTAAMSASAIQTYLNTMSTSYQVSQPITVDSSRLPKAIYSITLVLTNFLGLSSSKSLIVVQTADRDIPSLSIIGPLYQTIVASQPLSILSAASISACSSTAAASAVKYTWSVRSSGVDLSLKSTSVDPSKFSLPAYALSFDKTYVITVTASSRTSSSSTSATVYVASGAIIAAVVGGYTRSSPLNRELILDASISYDTNISPTAAATLTYQWSCTIASFNGYGEECGVFSSVDTASSMLMMPANSMSIADKYAYTVVVTSNGRSAKNTVTVVPQAAGAELSIATSFTRFSSASRLIVEGSLSSSVDVSAVWTVSTALGAVVPFTALTTASKTFSAIDAQNKIRFPLCIGPGNFQGGSAYLFRLTVHPINNASIATFAEITLNVNAAPTGGYVSTTPELGSALVTSFLIATPGWTADSSAFPLSYSFAYQLVEGASYFTIAAASLRAFTTTTLPAGGSAVKHTMTLRSQATDIFTSSASAYGMVVVKSQASTNVSHVLITGLSDAFSSGNINRAFQTVNNVASTVNMVNCTGAPNCTALYRTSCSRTAGTCGSCLPGYSGTLEDSNIICHSTLSGANSSTAVGAICSRNSNCLYNICTNGVCTAPPMTCPTSIADAVCTGHGSCLFKDPSGNPIQSCSAFNTTCAASCSCDTGYGGRDCSLNEFAVTSRDSLRSTLCQAIVTAAALQDSSYSLLSTLTASLLSSFSPYEVVSASAQDVCSKALLVLSTLSGEGYIQGSRSLSQSIASVISSYTVTAPATNRSSNTSSSLYPVSSAVSGLISGLGMGMAVGEAPADFVTRNIRLSVSSTVITTMKLSEFSPISSSSASYGSVQSKIALGPSGLNACAFTGGYAQVSVLEWLNNPYANSVSVKSPLLRLSMSALKTSAKPAATTKKDSATVHLPGVPVYSVTLQFSGVQNFNFSASMKYSSEGQIKSRWNFTLPACKMFNGVSYVPCKGCNISSYTNYNVTYGCFDITQLCPSTNVRRNLFETENENKNENENEDEDENDENSHSGSGAEFQSFDRRSLDVSSEEPQTSTYGMILSSIKAELTSVLSSNPFLLNPGQSVLVLTFVSTLGGIIFIVLVFLIRLDHSEKLQKCYMEKATDEVARKLLEESLKSGGQGDLGEVYQLCAQKVHADINAKQGITGSINRAKTRAHKIWEWGYKNTTKDQKKTLSKIKSFASSFYMSNPFAKARGKLENDEDDGCDIPQSDRQIENTAIITEFLQKLFPGCSIFSGRNDAFQVIATNHDYFKMFIGSDVTKSRTIRFLDVVTVILSCIFADTVFFGIFFPSDTDCAVSRDKTSCLLPPSKIVAGQPLCTWDPIATSCSLTPPPSNASFTIIVSLLTLLLSVPLIIIIHLLIDIYASRWPGSRGFEDDITDEMIKRKNDNDIKRLKVKDAASMLWNTACKSEFGEVVKTSAQIKASAGVDTQIEQSQMAYTDFTSSAEESVSIMERVHSFLFFNNENDKWLPWEVLKVTDSRSQARQVKIEAIDEQLGIQPNGSFLPLTLRQRLVFRTPLKKLEYKIGKVRLKAKEIIREIESLKPWESDMKDKKLMRCFILECLGPFKRFAFEQNNSSYDKSTARRPSWTMYIASWIFVTSVLCFYIYWIFAWGVYNGEKTLAAWGIVYALSAANDILLVQVTKIFILYYLPAMAMQPQLLRIRKVLADICMTYVNRTDSDRADVAADVAIDDADSLSVVQYMSATCRASRSLELRKLPASWLFRQIDDLDARKCREGRLTYPGPLSFLFIAIPMTLILFHKNIGAAIIDTIIPSAYSGIMLLGSALYDISLATLLLPFCIIIGAILYLIFVYFPSYNAYRLRQEILHRTDAQAVTHSKARYATNKNHGPSNGSPFFTNIESHFSRFYRNIKHSIQNTATYTSFQYIAHEKQRRRVEISQWRDMNTILPHQGHVQIEKKGYNDEYAQTSNADSCPPSPSFVPPKIIVDMMIPETSWKRRRSSNFPLLQIDKKIDQTGIINKNVKSVTLKENVKKGKDERILIQKTGMKKKAYVRPSTTLCDAKKAMYTMRLKLHPTVTESEHEKYLDVPVLDLLDEFEELMTVFAPDGILMTETERSEAVDFFNEWKDSLVLRVKVNRVGDAVVYSQMINFSHFEKWFITDFMSTMHGIVVDRFVDHTLRFGPYFKMKVVDTKAPNVDVIPAAVDPEQFGSNVLDMSQYISNEVSI